MVYEGMTMVNKLLIVLILLAIEQPLMQLITIFFLQFICLNYLIWVKPH